MRKSILIIAVVLLSFLSAGMTLLPDARATTRYVGGGGPGNYTTIQEAIDVAIPGDVVYVYSGFYYEWLEINRTLTLRGEDRNTTVVEGGMIRDVIRISSDWVNVTGFTLDGYDPYFAQVAGVDLSNVQHCRILDNIILRNYHGISMTESHNNTVVGNVFDEGEEAITVSMSNDNAIEDNLIMGHRRAIGIYSSERDVIRNNTMIRSSIIMEGDLVEHWNTHAIETSNTVNGKPVYYWKNVTSGTVPAGAGEVILANCTSVAVENQTMHNGTVGIGLGFSTGITIANNSISGRVSGMAIRHSSRNCIRANEISGGLAGVSMSFSNDTEISRLNATDCGIGVTCWQCSNNTIKNGSFSSGVRGVYLVESSGNRVIGNSVTSNTAYGVHLYYLSTGNTVAGNTITSGSTTGLRIEYSSDNEVHNNTISSNGGFGVYVSESDGNTFRSNDILENDGYGIFLRDSDGNQIAENNVSAARGTITDGFGIGLNSSNDNALVRNQLWFNQYGAFSLWWSHGNRIAENNVSRNHFGVDVWLSSNTTIEGNNISQNNATAVYLTFTENSRIADNHLVGNFNGIILDQSDNITVSGNEASWNSWSGIFADGVPSGHVISDNDFSHNQEGIVFRYQDSNIVSGNTISWNSNNGIYLYGSWGSTIADNLVMQNGVGINLTFSSNNTVFDNNIVDNGEQAHDDRDDNQWDDGYPSGGNYWSDYNGTDNKSGPNQDQPGADGIGDTPYDIDGDSRDRYPFMNASIGFDPRPPTVLEAHLSGNGFENVTVRWSLSPDDGAGMDTVHIYGVSRGSTYDPNGVGYQLLGYAPEGTDFYVDNYSGEGDPSDYYYIVTAIDLAGNGGCSAIQAAKSTRPLAQGPKLVSFPLIQSNESAETVLQTVKYDGAWFYESFSQEWNWYMKDKTYSGGLSSMNHTMGVWVNVTQDCNLTVAGVVPAQTTIQLYAGWNLVSFPSLNASYTVAELKAETGATRVEGFDPNPPHYLRVLGDADVLQVGCGYWVKVEADTIWTVSFA